MKKDLILALDQGTTGSTALFLDVSNPHAPKVAAKATADFRQHFPASGWVEHNPDEIWESICKAIDAAAKKIPTNSGASVFDRVASIGITNQRETICVFDRKTSAPIHNAIVWQCRRSTKICEELKAAGHEKSIRQKTGLVLDPYFSGTKILWLMQNKPDVADAIKSGRAILGTIDSWLTHKLTGGLSHVTESSNASRTMLYNINTNAWDEDLIKIFGLPSTQCLPEIRSSAGSFGVTKSCGVIPDGVAIHGILGDQQAALAGQACFNEGEAKCTYGTGAFLLLNAGNKPIIPEHGILSTVAWNINGQVTYALEGSSFIAGAAVQFIRDQLQFLESSAQSEEIALQGRAAPELYFVPALAGLSAPWWVPTARGAFLGMHRGTTKNDLVRAALEGIALQVTDLATAMKKVLGKDLKVLRVDGGAAANNFLMQFQSDTLNVNVDRPRDIESTAIGAAFFAGLGSGIYKSFDDLKKARVTDRNFLPHADTAAVQRIVTIKAGWVRAVAAVKVFAGV